MKRNVLVAHLLMSCLAVSACAPDPRVVAEALRPDRTNPERFVCDPAGTRPQVPPELVIDWQRVVTVDQARREHEAFVSRLRDREGIVTGYLVRVEGRLFTCFSNMAWQRDFYAGLPDGP